MKSGLNPRLVTFAIVCLFIFSSTLAIFGIGFSVNSSNEPSSTRQTEEMENINVYFHRDNSMDTQYNESAVVEFRQVLNDGEEVEFQLEPALFSELRVKGTPFGTDIVFEVWLSTRNIDPRSSNALVSIQILDDNDVIASDTFTIRATEEQNLFRVPFVTSGKEYHTFSQGSVMKVAINNSNAPIRLEYDGASNNGFIILTCNPITKITVAAHHQDGSLGEFYPNLPYDDQRFIQFRGTVTDAFGAYDISLVEITLEGLFTDQDANYTYYADQATGQFTLDYEYPAGLSPKIYDFTAKITLNNEDVTYLKSNSLTMARFGVYLETPTPSGEGVAGSVVPFDILVYNVGGESDIIDLGASLDLTGWIASFQGGSKTGTLPPGESQTKVLDVTVSPNAAKNEECIVTVTGTASNDKKETLLISVFAKPKADFEFDPPAELQKNIPEGGGSVEYAFLLKNTGQEKDIYTVTADAPSASGWSASLYTLEPTAVKVSDYEWTIELGSGKQVSFSFTVTAQSDPSTKKVELEVEAAASNASTSIKHKTISIILSEPGTLLITAVNNVDTKEANPGSSIEANDTMNVGFSLDVENQDQLETFSVSLEVTNQQSDWDYSFSTDNFELDADKTKRVSLTVTLPETTTANPDTGYQVTVRATYGTPSENLGSKTLELSVIVPEVYDVFLSAETTDTSVVAGKTVTYDISIINKGNVEDVDVEVTTNELVNWDISISRTSITLGAYDTEIKVIISVTPSTTIEDGEKGIVDVKVTANGDVISNTLNLKTTVKKDVGSEISEFFMDYWYIPFFVVVIFILTFIIRRRIR
ncbi:COG1470 family protein [[Eubacterium] cellulosolvens]